MTRLPPPRQPDTALLRLESQQVRPEPCQHVWEPHTATRRCSAPQTKQTAPTSGCVEPKMGIPDATDHHPLPLSDTRNQTGMCLQKLGTLVLNTRQTSGAASPGAAGRASPMTQGGDLSALGGLAQPPLLQPLQSIALLLQSSRF